MKLERKIGGRSVAVRVPHQLAPFADDLLDKLVELDAAGPKLQPGSKIGFGWSVLTLDESSSEELEIREPDFTDDSLTRTQLGASDTLEVLANQFAVARDAGAQPLATWYNQQVVVEPGVLDEERVYVQRRPPAFKDDSGWYIGSVAKKNAPASSELDTMPVWRVFTRRRGLLDAMGLPVGYIATFVDDLIERILDPEDKEVFRLYPP